MREKPTMDIKIRDEHFKATTIMPADNPGKAAMEHQDELERPGEPHDILLSKDRSYCHHCKIMWIKRKK